MKLKPLSIGFMLLLTLANAAPALACSGAPLTMDQMLRSTLIKAQVVEHDLHSQNYVLQVESYITGEPGAEYILLQLNSPALDFGLQMGYEGGGDCNEIFPPLPEAASFYMFIHRSSYGHYRPGGGVFAKLYYEFTEENPMVTFKENITDYEFDDYRAEYVTYEVDEAGFLEYFAEKTDYTPQSPLTDQPYPRKSLLLLVSETGSRYLLPIDSQTPFVTTDVNLSLAMVGFPDASLSFWALPRDCYSITQSPSCTLVPLPGFTGVRRYVNGQPDYFLNAHGRPIAKGDDMSMAASGELAVWDSENLNLYSLYANIPLDTEDSKPLISIPLDGELRQPAWSNDGTQFAFSDNGGVWVVQTSLATRDHNPVSVADRGHPLHFSPDGKYLAIADQDTRYTLELETGERLPYRVYSPDMQHFVEFQETILLDGTTEIAQQADAVAWKDPSTIILRAENVISWFNLTGEQLFTESGSHFEVARLGEVAVLVDEKTISIDQQTYSIELVGDIVEIHWLPPLWVYM